MGEGFDQLVEAINRLGAAGGIIFLILWWFERSDRRALQAKIDQLVEAERKEREDLLRETIGAVSASAGGLKETAVGIQEIRASLGSIADIVRNIAARSK